MNLLTKKWLLVWGLVLFGIMFTFWDYRNYRKIETENYGHGPGDQLVSWEVDQLYQDEIRRFRIKYPKELKLDEKNLTFSNNEVSANVSVREKTNGTLKDWEDKEIASFAKNEQMYGERSYENTERTNMTVINFQRFEGDQTKMISVYLAKKEDRLYKFIFETDLANWQKNQGNFKLMARTLVLL